VRSLPCDARVDTVLRGDTEVFVAMSESVVFIGDAWSAGFRWEAWFPEYEIHGFAFVGGTDEVLEHVDSVLEITPSAVVVQVGASDLCQGRSDEHIVRNIESILYGLRKGLPFCHIVVHSVPPLKPDLASLLRSINHHLRQFAPTVKARYIDLWPALADPDGSLSLNWSNDKLHLTDEGLGAWVSLLRPALIDMFEQSHLSA